MLFLGLIAILSTCPLDAGATPELPQQNASLKPDPSTKSPSEAAATVSPITAAAAVVPTSSGRDVEASLGTSLSTGHFGSSSGTSIWSTAFGARATVGSVRFSASVPYMRLRSNATIFTGIDSTPVLVASGTGPKRMNRGFGDATLGVSYTLPHPTDGLEMEFAGRVKFPTASDSSRLSSGKTDYSFGVQATKVVGKIAPFVSATYRILGDPAGFNLRNGFAASAGSSLILDRRTVLLGSYHYARAASRLIHDGNELFLGGSREVAASGLRLTGFTTIGLSSGAAAASGGIALSLAL